MFGNHCYELFLSQVESIGQHWLFSLSFVLKFEKHEFFVVFLNDSSKNMINYAKDINNSDRFYDDIIFMIDTELGTIRSLSVIFCMSRMSLILLKSNFIMILINDLS